MNRRFNPAVPWSTVVATINYPSEREASRVQLYDGINHGLASLWHPKRVHSPAYKVIHYETCAELDSVGAMSASGSTRCFIDQFIRSRCARMV